MERMLSHPRPLGVTIIAVLMIILGVIALIVGGIAIAGFSSVGHILYAGGHGRTGTAVDVVGDVLGGIPVILGLLALIFAWGLWTLRRWAFWLTVILDVIILLSRIRDLFHPAAHVGGIVVGIIAILILVYLFADRNVRAAFRT